MAARRSRRWTSARCWQPGSRRCPPRGSCRSCDAVDDLAGMADLADLTEHERQNRASWNADADDYQARHGPELADSGGVAWGTTQVPESELRILGDVSGKDILELGCGGAQWSIGLARLGARPVGIDLSE